MAIEPQLQDWILTRFQKWSTTLNVSHYYKGIMGKKNYLCWQIAGQIAKLYCALLEWKVNSFMLDHIRPPCQWLLSYNSIPRNLLFLNHNGMYTWNRSLMFQYRNWSVIYGKTYTYALEICLQFCSSSSSRSVSEINCAWNCLLSALKMRCKLWFKSRLKWWTTELPKSLGLKTKCKFKPKDFYK